jgi:hypothetical protein
MRLRVVGTLDGHIATAGRLALESGAKVAHVDGIDEALMALRSGQGADMVMVEVNLDIGALCRSLKSEQHLHHFFHHHKQAHLQQSSTAKVLSPY